MQEIKISVTQEDLNHCEKYEESIEDYPLYGHTSNLCKADIVLLSKLMGYEFGNDATLEVTIQVKHLEAAAIVPPRKQLP